MPSTEAPVVGTLTTAEDMRRAADLYRRVFGYQDPAHSVNPRLLASLVLNGGSVVGAHDEYGELIAFAYGFVGVDGAQTYHYSQAAVVDPRHQGRGLGRALKRAQRDVAVSHGQTRMRWSYDPALTRNAHFNLDVLGAVGRWFLADLFGVPGTDRVVVEWDLDDERRAAAALPATAPPATPSAVAEFTAPAAWLRPHRDGDDAWLPLPVDLSAATRRDRSSLDVRHELGQAIDALLTAGHVAVSCVPLDADIAVYRFVSATR